MNKLQEYIITLGIIIFFFTMYVTGAFFVVVPFLLTDIVCRMFIRGKINKSDKNETFSKNV
ncbi:hypothetical protein ACVWYV_000931 [Pantoea eucalypti]